jgi:hypothetical protein
MLQVHDQALSVMNSKGDKCCIYITNTEALMSGFSSLEIEKFARTFYSKMNLIYTKPTGRQRRID